MAFEYCFARKVHPPSGVPETPFKVYLIQVRVYPKLRAAYHNPDPIHHGTIHATDTTQAKAVAKAYEEVLAAMEIAYPDTLLSVTTYLESVQQLESSEVKAWNVTTYKKETSYIKETK